MRRVLLWAARSRWLRVHLARRWFVRRAVHSFMPGEDVADALAAAERYREAGMGSVFTLLGENLTEFSAGERAAEQYRRLLDEIAARKLDAELSVKLTQLGFDLDPEAAYGLLDGLARKAAERSTWVWIDMEGSDYTEATVACYERAAREHRNVGLCLQAYLHRTMGDIVRLLPVVPSVRLVKGAYDEPAMVADRPGPQVDAAYLAIALVLLEAQAAGRVQRAILGTHDTRLIEQAARSARAFGLEVGQIEVQMLYGIRVDEQRRLVKAGYDVRGLIAYGTYWYPWYMRRLAERPQNVVFALRQLLP